eukprot:12205322-Alexandrium_andersonii.AAC.1
MASCSCSFKNCSCAPERLPSPEHSPGALGMPEALMATAPWGGQGGRGDTHNGQPRGGWATATRSATTCIDPMQSSV